MKLMQLVRECFGDDHSTQAIEEFLHLNNFLRDNTILLAGVPEELATFILSFKSRIQLKNTEKVSQEVLQVCKNKLDQINDPLVLNVLNKLLLHFSKKIYSQIEALKTAPFEISDISPFDQADQIVKPINELLAHIKTKKITPKLLNRLVQECCAGDEYPVAEKENLINFLQAHSRKYCKFYSQIKKQSSLRTK